MTTDISRCYGLIGYPVKHSFSPAMHNAAFKKLNINALYKLFEVPEKELDHFLNSLSDNGITGINVTIPYKEKVIPALNWKSPEAAFTGAANVILRRDGGLSGWNTDGLGFIKHIKDDLSFEPSGKNAAVIGAGGAAKAVVGQLALSGIKHLRIYDIDRQKADALAIKTGREFPSCRVEASESIEKLEIKESDLLVNASPVGMKSTDPRLVRSNMLHPGMLVYDLIYNPEMTTLLEDARAAGCRVSNGLGMLLYQGAKTFEIFTDMPAPVEVMREALNEEMARWRKK